MQQTADPEPVFPARRRRRLVVLAVAAGAAVIVLCATFYKRLVRLLAFPVFARPRQDEPDVIDAGPLTNYGQSRVYLEFKSSHGFWIVRDANDTLFALKAICTHLGCTPDWASEQQKFVCPCHGSQYAMTGKNLKGPTRRPLERFKVEVRGDHLFVDTAVTYLAELGEWDDPGASLVLEPQ